MECGLLNLDFFYVSFFLKKKNRPLIAPILIHYWMPLKKRKRKQPSQSVLGVLKLRRQNQDEIKTIQSALDAYNQAQTDTVQSVALDSDATVKSYDESPVQNQHKSDSSCLIGSISEAFDDITRNRGRRVLHKELQRLECRDAASREAIRRADEELILSSQCQSEFAMLYSRTRAGSIGESPYVVLNEQRRCEMCKSDVAMTTVEPLSELVCEECGYTKPFVEYTLGNLSITEPREFYSCSYKRLNHLLNYLQHLQAKEEAPVPEILKRDVKRHLLVVGGGSLDNLRKHAPKRYILDQISGCIRGSKYPKRFGSRTVQIMKEVLGLEIPRLLHGEVRQIKTKFRYLSMLYFKFAPQERRNFLSYPFAAWILIDLVSPGHALLDYIQLLKNLPKLRAQENTVRRIFSHLKWPFKNIPWKSIRSSRLNYSGCSSALALSENHGSVRVRLSGIKRK